MGAYSEYNQEQPAVSVEHLNMILLACSPRFEYTFIAVVLSK